MHSVPHHKRTALALLLLVLVSSAPVTKAQEGTGLRLQVLNIITKDDQGKSLSMPTSVCYNKQEDELMVIDSPKAKIIIYSPELFPYFSLGPGRDVLVPRAIAIGPKGYIYIAQGLGALNQKVPKITILNRAGIKVKDIPLKFTPDSVAVDKSGRIYVTGLNMPKCYILDQEGNILKIISPKDRISPDEEEREAVLSDVYIDSRGRVYLLSEQMGRVYVYNQNGKLLFKAGQKGGTPGKLSRPRGVAADPARGVIYVVDYMRHAIQLLDYETGKYIGEVGGRGWAPGWFNYPTDIDVDNQGNIYVSDLFNRRVQVLRVETQYPNIK